VNDNAAVFASSSFVVNVSECLPVGTPVAYLTADDADAEENGRLTYSIVDDSGRAGGLFDVGSASGTLKVTRTIGMRNRRAQYKSNTDYKQGCQVFFGSHGAKHWRKVAQFLFLR